MTEIEPAENNPPEVVSLDNLGGAVAFTEPRPRSDRDGTNALADIGQYATTTRTDLRIATEQSRQLLFKWLMALLTVEILGLYLLVAVTSITVGEVLQVWGAVGPPVTGLLGLATSHYFHHDRVHSPASWVP